MKTLINKKHFPVCFRIIASIAGTAALNLYFFEPAQILYFNSILNLILFSAVYFCSGKAFYTKERGITRYTLIASIPLSLMLVFGASISQYNDMRLIFGSFTNFLLSLLQVVGFTVVFYEALVHLFCYVVEKEDKPPLRKKEFCFFTANKRSFFLCWAVLFVLWLPCYIAYFPGCFTYDMANQTYQALGLFPFNSHHPVIHTAIYSIFVQIGVTANYPALGLILYSITQMLALSASFSYALYYLAKIKMNVYVRLATLLYFALHPFHALFSFIAIKDVMFSIASLFLFIQLLDMCLDPKAYWHSKSKIALFIITGFFFCITRNNAWPAFLLCAPFFVFAFRKYWKPMLAVLVSVVLLNYSYQFVLFNLLKVEKGNPVESLCVPLQQLANLTTTKADELSAQDMATISELFPPGSYNPRFADVVKSHTDTDKLFEQPMKYIGLWTRLFFQFPQQYISAFLSNNLGYWYTDALCPDPYSKKLYIETFMDSIPQFSITRPESVFPDLFQAYEAVAHGEAMQKVPVLSMLFSMGFPIWLYFVFLLLLMAKKNKFWIALLPSLAYWLTLMAGPVSNGRYIYPLFVLMPIVIALPFYRNASALGTKPYVSVPVSKMKRTK